MEKYKKEHIDTTNLENKIEEIEQNKKGLVKLYSINKIDENEFEELNNEYKNKILEYKAQLIDIKNDKYGREMEKMLVK